MTEYLDRYPTMHEYAEGKRINPKLTDLISRADAIEAVESLPNTPNGFSDTYDKACIIGLIEALPSADAVDCTDFIEWLVDRVLDETIWEYNSVAYGEIICRKLEKLGVLEVTEEPSYYIRPSADAVDVNDVTIHYKPYPSADAVHGEWKIDEYGIYHCPFCHAINNTVYKSFCPNCGAKMDKGGDDE